MMGLRNRFARWVHGQTTAMPELACIICSRPLTDLVLEGVTVHACTDHGAWLQPEQLDAITEDHTDEATPEQEAEAWTYSEANPPELVEERFRSCPVCARTLRKDDWKYGSGVVVDVCDEHGLWVDRGEIERIEAWQEAWHTFTA